MGCSNEMSKMRFGDNWKVWRLTIFFLISSFVLSPTMVDCDSSSMLTIEFSKGDTGLNVDAFSD